MDGLSLFACSIGLSVVASKLKLFQYEKLVTVSAPGKALLAGGYLILEKGNVGFTLGVSSRFYASVHWLPSDTVDNSLKREIVVDSPQFHSSLRLEFDFATKSLSFVQGTSNEFIEKTLWFVLSYVAEYLNAHGGVKQGLVQIPSVIEVKLRAANDFYSQIDELNKLSLARTSKNLATIPQFKPCPLDKDGNVQVAKTGLGSSAALVTSLVGALLQAFSVISAGEKGAYSTSHMALVHNLAQVAHSLAQGKIGSGFDVSSAVYGTQIYERFDAQALNDSFTEDLSTIKELSGAVVKSNTSIFNIIHNSPAIWNQRMTPVTLPAGMDIVMGDVFGGSNSPSMAKKVLAWRKSSSSADEYWKALAGYNHQICDILIDVKKASEEDPLQYMRALQLANCTPHNQWRYASTMHDGGIELNLLFKLRMAFKEAKTILKAIGVAAGVEIEPDCQTRLIEMTENITGVLCAGVPGAGGVDAVFAIVLSPEARERVEILWSNWVDTPASPEETTIKYVCPLVLSANLDSGGLRFETEVSWNGDNSRVGKPKDNTVKRCPFAPINPKDDPAQYMSNHGGGCPFMDEDKNTPQAGSSEKKCPFKFGSSDAASLTGNLSLDAMLKAGGGCPFKDDDDEEDAEGGSCPFSLDGIVK